MGDRHDAATKLLLKADLLLADLSCRNLDLCDHAVSNRYSVEVVHRRTLGSILFGVLPQVALERVDFEYDVAVRHLSYSDHGHLDGVRKLHADAHAAVVRKFPLLVAVLAQVCLEELAVEHHRRPFPYVCGNWIASFGFLIAEMTFSATFAISLSPQNGSF